MSASMHDQDLNHDRIDPAMEALGLHRQQHRKSALELLPIELQLAVIEHLTYTARIALAYTNQYFHSLIDRRPPTSREERLSFIVEGETWPIYSNAQYLACHQCLKLRPADVFADAQIRGKRSRGFSDSDRRFCVRCGIEKHIYMPGQHVNLIETPGVATTSVLRFSICWCCRFQRNGSYCLVFGVCDHCSEELSPTLHYNWDQADQSCMRLFKCHRCGQIGSLVQYDVPLRGQIDDVMRQYRSCAS